jgi:farnesyl-diphosphate farnesyltransferase
MIVGLIHMDAINTGVHLDAQHIESDVDSDAMTVLEQTSRTFFIPISRMPDGLREATTSAYLCMRAIDEIEDHANLSNTEKAALLGQISLTLQAFSYEPNADVAAALSGVLQPHARVLPEVSLRLGEWAAHAPAAIAPRIISDTIAMADRMMYWASVNWRIGSQAGLDAYTYSVAAAVGLLMCDLAAWYDGTALDRNAAIYFGRGLQVTNIARNRNEDIARGVDFYPPGWDDTDVRNYAAHWLRLTARYAETLPEAPFTYFIKIPLMLAEATLDALSNGQAKLTREAVLSIINT